MLVPAMVIDGMYRALYRGQLDRSWRSAMRYGLISLPVFPALAFLWYWSFAGDLGMSFRAVCFACCFAPLAPCSLQLWQERQPNDGVTMRSGQALKSTIRSARSELIEPLNIHGASRWH